MSAQLGFVEGELTIFSDGFSEAQPEIEVSNALSILNAMNVSPDQEGLLESFYIAAPIKAKHDLHSLTAHKKQTQKMWMALLRQNLSKSQRKSILGLMTDQIAPWFVNVELLMDFLTDSFNISGSTSLMALSGLFYMIQNKNLDYAQFYLKLYSLLDANILHSRHRSRFFRLLDTFLASTHLPATLVASFIKRLSRLTLHAPPSGVVVVVPWIYNLLKQHPSCTFMIHRNGELDKEEGGWGDPFLMDEPDPMETGALESSLWEIHMLQAHYHPNVATIAKILSEQFTKQTYNLEDFFDHSYGTVSLNPRSLFDLMILMGSRCLMQSSQRILESRLRLNTRYRRRFSRSVMQLLDRRTVYSLSFGHSASVLCRVTSTEAVLAVQV